MAAEQQSNPVIPGRLMMNASLLRTFWQLAPSGLAHHPIWMCTYGVEEDGNELTYRPWPDPPPYPSADRSAPKVVVSAIFQLADGASFEGFLKPPYGPDPQTLDVSYMQPRIFCSNGDAHNLVRRCWASGATRFASTLSPSI